MDVNMRTNVVLGLVGTMTVAACGDSTSPSEPSPDAGVGGSGAGNVDGDVEGAVGGSGGSSCDGTIDFQTDPQNCGTCGHDCLGGACEQGACLPFVLSTEGTEPASVEVDASHVYWAAGSSIFRVSKQGGASQRVADDLWNLSDIEVDGTTVFYVTDADMEATDVGAVPTEGGSPTLLGKAEGPDGMAVDEGYIYWASRYLGVYRMPKAGGAAEQLDSTTSLAVRIAIDTTSVYWFLHDTGVHGDAIGLIKTPIGGGFGTALVEPTGYPIDVAADGQHVFLSWRPQYGGDPNVIAQVPVAGGSVVTLDTPSDYPGLLALDADNVYYTVADGTVRRVAKGGGSVEVLASGQGTPTSITVDDAAVYWTRLPEGDPATVLAVAK